MQNRCAVADLAVHFFEVFSRLYCESVQKFEVMFRFQMYPPNKRFEPLCSSVNTNCTEQWTHRVTDRDNLVFGSDRTPNKSSEPLFVCTYTNCTGQTDRQNLTHFLASVCLFLKGLPPKQPEGFGCFVCPNLILPEIGRYFEIHLLLKLF